MIPRAISEGLYWTTERCMGRGDVRSRLQWLEKTQYLSPRECRELQLEKLQRLLCHAYATVPYYKNVFQNLGLRPSDISSVSDIVKLPILTRNLLSSSQKELVSTEADFATLTDNYSSGSTGRRACFKQDHNFRLWMRAHQLRTYKWCGNWRIGERFALLWGSELYWSFKTISDRFRNLVSNRREFNTFNLSPNLIKQFNAYLAKFDPVLISTYTNAMHLIAREAERSSLRVPSLRAIQGTSEPLPPIVRERLARIFRCEIYDKYGSRESNIVSHESPRHEGMLIQSENVVVEFIRDDGSPCVPGEQGRVVLTTLNNFSMPLIRYETSDISGPVEGYCSSGIGLPRMLPVAGRQQDLIVTKSGAYIDAYFFSYLIMRFDEIEWFQVVQTELDRLVIRVVSPRGLNENARRELAGQIRIHTDSDFGIEFDILDQMPSSPTGKFRLCVSNLSDVGTRLAEG